jgi:cysteine dioxygenase
LNQQPIDELCLRLTDALKRDPRGTQVPARLEEYASKYDDWRPMVHFSERSYTRNLVHRCGSFEMLLLAWGAGHESPVHDHAGQQCWMAVLDGELEELHLRSTPEGLVEGRSKVFKTGEVAYIQDEIALHLIRPRGGKPAISLHLYAKPIDTCKTFDRVTGKPSEVPLSYYSVRGVPCEDEPANEVRAQFA